METISSYEQQAIDFLNQTGAAIDIKFNRFGKHFDDDKEDRDIYTVKLANKGRIYTFEFGQSIMHSGKYIVRLGSTIFRFNTNKLPFDFMHKYSVRPNEVKANPDYEAPTAYSILACLQKYEVGTFKDFCNEFGYDERPLSDYDVVMQIYQAVTNEYMQLCSLFSNDELELMQEIQ